MLCIKCEKNKVFESFDDCLVCRLDKAIAKAKANPGIWNQTYKRSKRGPGRTRKKVDAYTVEGTFIATFESLKQAAEELGVHSSSVSACVTKRVPAIRGLTFRYHEKPSPDGSE